MAKEAKTPAAKTETKAAAPAFKYTLADLESATGLKGASLRAGLRAEGMTKTGSQWGWNTKTEFDAVVKAFKDRAGRAPAVNQKAPAASGKADKANVAKAPKGEAAAPKGRKAKAA